MNSFSIYKEDTRNVESSQGGFPVSMQDLQLSLQQENFQNLAPGDTPHPVTQSPSHECTGS